MAFTNNRLEFRNLQSYDEKTFGSAFSKGIVNRVTFGLDISGTNISAGTFINGGFFGQLGAKGETNGLTSAYNGYLHIKSEIKGAESTSTLHYSTSKVTTDPFDTSSIKYFCIYKLKNGAVEIDYRIPEASIDTSHFIHDGSLGTTVQKIDLSSGTLKIGNFDNNDATKHTSVLDFYSLYNSSQQENYNYRAYAGFRYKYKNKKNEYNSSSYLDFFLNDLDEVRLEYSRDRNQKKFDKEVAVVGDIFNTNATSSVKASNKFIERRIIDPLHNQANNTLIWKGAYFLSDTQNIPFNIPYLENIGFAPKITLKFSDYDQPTASAKDYNVVEYNIVNTNDADYGGASLGSAGQYASVACFSPLPGNSPHKIFAFEFDTKNNKLVGFTPTDTANYADSVIREIWIVNQ
jgi:hypothetical protein